MKLNKKHNKGGIFMSTFKKLFDRQIESKTRKAMREILQDERIRKDPQKPTRKA